MIGTSGRQNTDEIVNEEDIFIFMKHNKLLKWLSKKVYPQIYYSETNKNHRPWDNLEKNRVPNKG